MKWTLRTSLPSPTYLPALVLLGISSAQVRASAQEEVSPAEGLDEEAQGSAELGSAEVEELDVVELESDTSSDDASELTSDGELVVEEGGGGLFESATGSDDLGGEQEELSLQWGGYARGDTFVGVLPGSSEPGINAAYAELSLQPRVKTGSWGSAFADLRFRYGQQLEVRDLFVDLREAYASAYLGPVELRFGKQVVVWGRADGFNPTSNIAPVDFRIRSPIEDDRRIGTVGARGFVTWSPFKLEAVWMPLYEPTMYPEFEIGDGVTHFVDPYYPSLSLRNSLTAARLHLELSSFDASVSYLYGNAPLPGIDLESYAIGAMSQGYPEDAYVNIRRRAYRHHVIGADFSTTVRDWFGLRGEAAYRHPVKYKSRPWAARPDLQWVVGIDREFGSVGIIAQYLGRYTFDWEPKRQVDPRGTAGLAVLDPNSDTDHQEAQEAIANTLMNTNRMLFSQLHKTQHLASLRVEWKTLHDTLSVSALGLYNFMTDEWLLAPKVGYQIGGGLTAYAGAEIYNGKKGTLMDLIDEKLTAGYLELRASF